MNQYENLQNHHALILVVDDNPDFLAGVQLTLEMEGFKVLPALNGQQALDALTAITNPANLPDLIMADIMMPKIDGYMLYEKVRANPNLNHIPFIFLTAKTGDEDIRHGKELGIDDYLTKPCTPEDLLASVRGKLRRVEERRTLLSQFFGESGEISGMRWIIVLVIIGILMTIAFCLGALPLPW